MRLILCTLMLAAAARGQTVYPEVIHYQAGATNVVSFTTAPSVGDAVYVVTTAGQGTSGIVANAPTDNQGNTYTIGKQQNNSNGQRLVAISCSIVATSSGTFTVTQTFTPSPYTYSHVLLYRVTGGSCTVNTSSGIDLAPVEYPPWNAYTGTVTTTAAATLVLAGIESNCSSACAVAASSGYTMSSDMVDQNPGNARTQAGSMYRVLSSTATLTPQFTNSGGGTQATTAVIAYEAAAAPPALTITTTSLPNAIVATAYSQSLASSAGTTPYSYAVTTGSLPAGLSMSSAGAITGTPTTAGSSTFTVTVTDAASATDTQELTIVVDPLAYITSAASGNWNSTATWSPAQIPVSGDKVKIADGHTITVPNGYTAVVGDSPTTDTSGNPAIQCTSASGTGVLVVATGGTLRFRGPVHQCVTWTVQAGATLEHDSSLAAVPGNAHYRWHIGRRSTSGAYLALSGTAGSHVTLRSYTGSGTSGGFFGDSTLWNEVGLIQGSYVDATGWGAGGEFARIAMVYVAGTSFLDNSVLDGCGPLNVTYLGTTANFRLLNNKIIAPVESAYGSVALMTSSGLTTWASGERRIEHNYIEGTVSLTGVSGSSPNTGFSVKNNVFAGGTAAQHPPLAGFARVATAGWDLNILWNRHDGNGSPGWVPDGDVFRTIALRCCGSHGNVHWLAARSPNMVGFIQEGEQDQGSAGGDFVQLDVTSYSRTANFEDGLVVPSPSGQGHGTFINMSTTTAHDGSTHFYPQVSLKKCTIALDSAESGTSQCGATTESNAGAAGLFQSIQSNIGYRPTSGNGRLVYPNPSATQVSGTFGGADYNWFWNVATTLKYREADTSPAYYSPAPGTHDTTAVDPLFVEPTRSFLAWGQRLKPSISNWAGVIAELAKMNDADFDRRFTIEDAYNWIRAGFQPRNGATRTAGYGGGQVGAVPFNSTFGVLAQ